MVKYLVLILTISAFNATAVDLTSSGLESASTSAPEYSLLSTDSFAKLESLYMAGVMASAQDLDGWKSGRCTNFDSRTVELNALLAGLIISGTGGSTFKFIHIHQNNGSADSFDNMTEGFKQSISEYIDQSIGEISEPFISNGSLVATNQPGGVDWRIRKSGSNLVEAVTSLEDRPDLGLKRGDVYCYCYYSKKVN